MEEVSLQQVNYSILLILFNYCTILWLLTFHLNEVCTPIHILNYCSFAYSLVFTKNARDVPIRLYVDSGSWLLLR